MKKNAFTRFDFLIVLALLGLFVLMVLPNFNKEVETRRLIQTENVLMAVRAEQEALCNLAKPYTMQSSQLISLPTAGSSPFFYTLTSTGIDATSSNGYVLRMPSYADGRVCCQEQPEDTGVCRKLGRAYLSCDELERQSDFVTADTNCMALRNTLVLPSATPTQCTVPSVTKDPQVVTDEKGCTVITSYKFNSNPAICDWEQDRIVRKNCKEKSTGKSSSTQSGSACKEDDVRNVTCVCGQESGEVCIDGAWEAYSGGTCALTTKEKDSCQCEKKPKAYLCPDCGETIEPVCNAATGNWLEPDIAKCKDKMFCTTNETESCLFGCPFCNQFYQSFLCNEKASYSVSKADELATEQGHMASLSYIASQCCVSNETKSGFHMRPSENFTVLLDSGRVYNGTVTTRDCSMWAQGKRVQACPEDKRELVALCDTCDPAKDTCEVACYDKESYQSVRSGFSVEPVTAHGCEAGYIDANGGEKIWLSWPAKATGGKCFGQSAGYMGADKELICQSGFTVPLSSLASQCQTCGGLARQVPGVFACSGKKQSAAEGTLLCILPAYEKIRGYSCQKAP